MATTKKLMGTTAVGGADLLAIEDVFSTYLYTGNGSTQTITNGIDLAGEGGMVWFKNRQYSYDHLIWDTERGSAGLFTNSTAAQNTGYSSFFTSYNSDGISFTGSFIGNASGSPHVAWTFRKAPRFFDVVTWTGDNVQGRAISHNLGDVPGCIVVKITSGASDNWVVYHRSVGAGKFLKLNATDSQLSSVAVFPTNPTDSVFYVGNDSAVNWSGGTYVAYLFAHDPLGPSGDGSDGLIACGSYTNSSTNDVYVDLGWEPQWVLVKNTTDSGNWNIVDNMRGLVADETNNQSKELNPNLSDAETSIRVIQPTPTGFYVQNSIDGGYNSGNATGTRTHIYIAIRRGPMRQPTSGTEVFAVDVDGTSGTPAAYTAGFPVDLGIYKSKLNAYSWSWNDRLRGAFSLKSDSTAAESANSLAVFDNMTGWADSAALTSEYPSWMFRRAPGFFDVVAYTGNGVAGTTEIHNLGVVPELMIVKRRSAVYDWVVYHKDVGATKALFLNKTDSAETQVQWWNNTAPTSSVFTKGNVLTFSGQTYIAYLFATLPGVSKVGSYTGNGGTGDINVDCGFTSGARFVLIKDATSANDWYVWDTARGIVAGNDPYLRLNSTGAETTDSDWVDPYSAGFTVTTGLYANLRINVLGNTYIYLAIA